MHRKNIIKLFSIFFMLAIFLIIFQGNVNATSPKLTHISIKTDKVAPGKKVYMELEGDKTNISEINIFLGGGSQEYTCKVLDFDTDEPYFMMPTAANAGEIWKIGTMIVSYKDSTTESYAKGIGEFLEIDGNDTVVVDYIDFKFSSNEAVRDGKLPIEIEIPNVQNPSFITLWLRNSANENANASVKDYNNNPYVVISTKDTGEKVSIGDTYRLTGISVGAKNANGDTEYYYYGADKSTNIMGETLYYTNLIIEGTETVKIMHNTDSLLTHISVITPRVAPGQKAFLELEGVNPTITGLNIYWEGPNNLFYPCDVIDMDGPRPYVIMPKNLENGSTWKIKSFRADFIDGSSEFLNVGGNDEVQIDYATLELVNYEGNVGEKFYINLDIPNIQNPEFISIWLVHTNFNNYNNDIVNTTINDYGNNPYFELIESTNGNNLIPGKDFEIIGITVAKKNSSNETEYFYYGYANKSNNISETTELYSNLIINGRDKVNLIDTNAKLKEISIISDDAIPGQKVFLDLKMNNKPGTTNLSVKKMKIFLFSHEGIKNCTCEVLDTVWGKNPYFIMPENAGLGYWEFETAEVEFSDGSKEIYDKKGVNGKVFLGNTIISVAGPITLHLEQNNYRPNDKVYVEVYIPNVDNCEWVGIWLKPKDGSSQKCIYLEDFKTNPYFVLDTSTEFKKLKAGDEFIITGLSLGMKNPSDVRYYSDEAGYLSFVGEDLIAIVGKSGSSVNYRSHIQDYGWEQDFKWDGQVSGTEGQSKRLEAFYLETYRGDGYALYRSHIQNIGWEKDWKSNGQMSGTEGQSLRLEAFQIKLAGELAKTHDIYYRIHVQNFGWLGWAKNRRICRFTRFWI